MAVFRLTFINFQLSGTIERRQKPLFNKVDKTKPFYGTIYLFNYWASSDLSRFHHEKNGDKSGFGDKSGEMWQIGLVKDFMRTIFSSKAQICENISWFQKLTKNSKK